MNAVTRRWLLRAAPALVAGLAGCEAFRDATSSTTTTTTSTSAGDTGAGAESAGDGSGRYPPARTLELRNESGTEQYVSVVVRRDDDILGSQTLEVPVGTSKRFTLQAETGMLAVDLETTTGRTANHVWPVGDTMGDLVVHLRPSEIEFSQTGQCLPQCPPLSRGGTAADFPYADEPVFVQSFYGSHVVLVNRAGRTRSVTVQIRHDGESILDYEYVVPPDVTLALPGVSASGDYTVRVESDAGTTTRDWRPAKERQLEVWLSGAGVDVTCGERTASFILSNEDDIPHQLDVWASRPDSQEQVFRETYIVTPGANYREAAVFTGSGQYELHAVTADGASAAYDWWLCPPRGPTEIGIESDGDISIFQHRTGG